MHCQSHLFGIPDDITYLNCAYMGPITHATVEAGHRAMLQKQQPYQITAPDFFDPVDQLKSKFSELVNVAEPQRISIIPSVSYGMSTVAKNLPVSPGENLVTLEEQFPSNIYCWTRLCQENDMKLRVIGAPQQKEDRGKLWNAHILEAIDDRTAAVTVGTVHWADGTLIDLEAIRQRTREVGAMLIVDGTQTVGARPFDVSRINPDALICAAYKWLLGPYSLGLAYFGPAFDGGTPLEENWINRLGSEDFQGLVQYQDQYHPYAVRYDMGEKSNFFLIPMLNSSLSQIMDWGVENIESYCKDLVNESLAELSERGFLIEDPQYRAHNIFGIRFPEGYQSEKFKVALQQHQVHVSFRGNAIRVSPHVYNHHQHLEKLSHCLLAGMN